MEVIWNRNPRFRVGGNIRESDGEKGKEEETIVNQIYKSYTIILATMSNVSDPGRILGGRITIWWSCNRQLTRIKPGRMWKKHVGAQPQNNKHTFGVSFVANIMEKYPLFMQFQMIARNLSTKVCQLRDESECARGSVARSVLWRCVQYTIL